MLIQLVGQNIRKIRKERNHSMEAFALMIDMQTSSLGRIERGVKNVSLGTLQKIAAGLNVLPHELFREENPKRPFHLLSLYAEKHLTAYIRPALLKHYDPILLLAFFQSDMLKKLTVRDIEVGAHTEAPME